MAHQKIGLGRLLGADQYYALGCEQGTGKTWMLLADAEYQHKCGRINAMLVIAPKGVHVNWVRREIPKHLGIPHRAEHWVPGSAAKHQRRMNRVLKGDPEEDGLLIFTMNVDAVNTKRGFDTAERFLNNYRVMMVVDESQRIKNPTAKRSKRIIELGGHAVSRRISSGTIVSNSPLDAFSQYEFLRSGLLGTTSYRAFVSEFAEVLPPMHPLVKNITDKMKEKGRRGNPQIVRQDKEGNPVYRNLEKLSRLMAPHTYRVTKDEALDLPPKIYQTAYFELDPEQRAIYEDVNRDRRYIRADGSIDIYIALTLISKLQQITSGFILVDGEPDHFDPDRASNRLQALSEVIQDTEGSVIVWARFREELRLVSAALREYGEVVEYHGGVKAKDREKAVDEFQDGTARFFVANPAAGGTGLTLTAARTVVYYSCSYSLEERVQSEDRAHRIGTHHPVVYIDLAAQDTVDERIASSLQSKRIVAEEILGGL